MGWGIGGILLFILVHGAGTKNGADWRARGGWINSVWGPRRTRRRWPP